VSVEKVCAAINANQGMSALTRDQYQSRVVDFFLKTGILINFGLSVALGIIIGVSIAGQIFYIMTLENLNYYALIKSIGASQKDILKMIITQAAVVGVIGYCLGIGATALWGLAIKNTTLAFLFPWQLLLFTAVIVCLICIFTAALSIQKVLRVDPKALMGN
jgi:putative ABC transport system permease protein